MQTEKYGDIWAQWMLQRRHGGDIEEQKKMLNFLGPVRDKIIQNARIKDGDILLDVGTGDGLIAFGALEQVGAKGRVIFSDISQDLLDHCRSLTEESGITDRCQFLKASADNLAGVNDAFVNAVTTRSVLIYVKDKQSAFNEFYRVLLPGGRLSIFEPINRFSYNPDPDNFWGYNVGPISGMVNKISEIYKNIQPASDPMLDFDERDLFSLAETAGFSEIHLELHADLTPIPASKWETVIRIAPNPRVPNLEEAMKQALTGEEIKEFTNHLRPLVEGGKGTKKMAMAYLWAQKN